MYRKNYTSIILFLISICHTHAQDNPWYLGIEGGYSLLGTEKASGDTFNSNIEFKNGATFGGLIGYDYGDYRIEAEIGKHLHNANKINITNQGGIGLGGLGNQNLISGKSNHTRYMVNIVYDLQNFNFNKTLEPFFGTGIGLSNIKWSNISTANASLTDDAEYVFSYQLFAGMRYVLSQNFELSLKYKYFRSIDVDLLDRLDNPFDISYDTHDFIFGVTYRFGLGGKSPTSSSARSNIPAIPVQKTNPTTVTNAVAPKETINKGPYKIYYEWDSSNIDDEGKEIIQRAASEAKKGSSVIIELEGHADRSGPEAYNEKLSLERAEKVKSALIQEEIESSMISVEAFGETAPEITTPDGVRERLNRRVVILIK